eukprot:TRINITY_DN36744_c0_g1_i2.p1 TRINITY_DN36744_c0_g1~~TRINITY_DN36744_c0_g1_i2.p1  ORF type:complete len:318 (-),score=34.58 TRINITY_DN36744_c0_g1_i2:449-1402(-)
MANFLHPAGRAVGREYAVEAPAHVHRGARRGQQPWNLPPAPEDTERWRAAAGHSADQLQVLPNEGGYGHDDPCAYLYEGLDEGHGPHDVYNPFNAAGSSDWSHQQSDGNGREWLSSGAEPFDLRGGWYQAPSALSTWSLDTTRIGVLSPDGHTVTYTAGPKRQTKGGSGEMIRLNSLTLLCSSAHHASGTRTYNFCVSEGSLGRADGVGFAFDTCVRRRNIKEMTTVFYSANGRICVRSGSQVRKLDHGMPNLVPGALLQVTADLESCLITFLFSYAGSSRQIDVSLAAELDDYTNLCFGGGFLCCVISETCAVQLW